MIAKFKKYCIPLMFLWIPILSNAQIYNDSIRSGANFEIAAFRLWMPTQKTPIHGVLVLVPGSNSDGRRDCEDSDWHNFAIKYNFAVMACYFKDYEHINPAAEYYSNARNGSGQALLEALDRFSILSGHTEIKVAPLLFYGHSAGGQFNYEFACWKPERTIAFVVGKGGIYYTALASEKTRSVPGIFFTGENDYIFRNYIIEGIFSINRRFGAIWTYAKEPRAHHEVGTTRILAEKYFDEIVPLRLPNEQSNSGNLVELIALKNEQHFLGNWRSLKIEPGENWNKKAEPTSWIPSRNFAKYWIKFHRRKKLIDHF